ncbi:DNA polymerase [Paracoccus denitrificans]|uniref:DNA polymerase n=1 Tax=Paracoccus denitrificans TaxID=266 RepID=UPI001E2BF0E8|nr:DNA polymerase [Paracoccus denitrificans]UFS66954.1 DNA polymerase [Paracoccus denitrificans]
MQPSTPRKLVFDIETDGLLDELTTIHSLCIQDVTTGETWSCADQPGYTPIASGVQLLEEAEWICGHNVIRFDVPAIQKIYPSFRPRKVLDTMLMGQLFQADISVDDARKVRRGTLPKNLLGSYSLEAYGHRLGLWKGDYAKVYADRLIADGWAKEAAKKEVWRLWNKEMQDYCEQDVAVTKRLLDFLRRLWTGNGTPWKHSDESVLMEHRVAEILSRQERWGFRFNVKKAEALYARLLKERLRLEEELKSTFKPWWASAGVVTVSKTRRLKRKDLPPVGLRYKRNGDPEPIYALEIYEEGARYTKLIRKEFNPSSGKQIEDRLRTLFGWEPTEFTPDGSAKTDEETLSALPWPEAKLLVRYLMVAKRIGQLAEGRNAWLKKERNGRIHGRVKTTGAVTRRMTHSDPNVAQVPSGRAEFGHECRELFEASEGFVLVGCDADALELRCLAGYMAPFDGGAYIETVLSGDKALGTDMHSVNARALGLDPKGTYHVGGQEQTGRDIAKTWFYAFIYGAGDEKLGTILGTQGNKKAVQAAGKKSREAFLKGLPALGKLVQAISDTVWGNPRRGIEGKGFLYGLDKGKIAVRHKHAALNTLLQSAGAIIMKKALVILDDDLQGLGMVPGEDYEFVANVHDELQMDVLPQHVEAVKRLAEDAIRKAGEVLSFKCPLAGNADAGANWSETH